MATAVIPKSVLRTDHSVTYGYGTVPALELEDGSIVWGLPGGGETRNKEYAKEFAMVIDLEIRRRLVDANQLLTRKTLCSKCNQTLH
jgi:hypothetical protein